MRAYILRRLMLMVPTFLGISMLTFALIQLAPGSPVAFKLRGLEGAMKSDAATAQIMEQTRALYGLDKPLHTQYFLWLGRLVTLDFGKSMKDQRPVMDKIAEALPITLQLNLISIFLVYLLSIPLGVYSATHAGAKTDSALTVGLFLLYSLPGFWVAMLLILFLGGGEYLDWFPIHGINSSGAESLPSGAWLLDRLWHMALPLFCLTYGSLAYLSRYMRAGMLDVLRQDYVRTARAYGFPERTVVWKYAMRNSLIAIVTLLGGLLPALIGGSIIIESIFSIPGMGRLAFEAVLSRDYPLIMGEVAIASLLTLAGLLLSDLLYVLVDPRIKLE
ncbi:MAG: ABC transporter permease [Candidatus Hydrogenedentes bacterium]|nr:ABC transporter permease [Candidatus Hydrogenedentota bacterium]